VALLERQHNAYRPEEPDPSKKGERWLFYCPGCEGMHSYVTQNAEGQKGPVWGFNRDEENPTFTPSLRINASFKPEDLYPNTAVHRCHLFLTNGQLRYLNDCTHALAGKTVPLPPIP